MAKTATDQPTSGEDSFAPPGRVLIVDQERAALKFYATVLQGQGYLVQACESYEEALCHLKAESFDFIIVDQGSPHFEGRCVLEQSIEKDRHLPVLVVARCHDMHCYLEAMQLGAVDYLAEPVAPTDFQWVVDTHLRSRNARA
jgi:DNA-binding NtrC family response regulator